MNTYKKTVDTRANTCYNITILEERRVGMKGSELKKLLKQGGCYRITHGKEHDMWFSPKTGKSFAVTRHDSKEIATGTCRSILKDAGLK